MSGERRRLTLRIPGGRTPTLTSVSKSNHNNTLDNRIIIADDKNESQINISNGKLQCNSDLTPKQKYFILMDSGILWTAIPNVFSLPLNFYLLLFNEENHLRNIFSLHLPCSIAELSNGELLKVNLESSRNFVMNLEFHTAN
jgi:hypothetical protein